MDFSFVVVRIMKIKLISIACLLEVARKKINLTVLNLNNGMDSAKDQFNKIFEEEQRFVIDWKSFYVSSSSEDEFEI
jgi:hypothetical protein